MCWHRFDTAQIFSWLHTLCWPWIDHRPGQVAAWPLSGDSYLKVCPCGSQSIWAINIHNWLRHQSPSTLINLQWICPVTDSSCPEEDRWDPTWPGHSIRPLGSNRGIFFFLMELWHWAGLRWRTRLVDGKQQSSAVSPAAVFQHQPVAVSFSLLLYIFDRHHPTHHVDQHSHLHH